MAVALVRWRRIDLTASPISHFIITQNPMNPAPIKPYSFTGNLISRRHFNNIVHLLTDRGKEGDASAASDLNHLARKQALDGLVPLIVKVRMKTARRVMASDIHDASPFNLIIKVLARKMNNIPTWLRVVKIMRACGVDPDEATCNLFAQAFLCRGDRIMADQLLMSMKEKGMLPDWDTYHCLVFEACKMGNLEKGKEILRLMAEQGKTWKAKTVKLVVYLMLERREVGEVVNYVMTFAIKDRESQKKIFEILVVKLMYDRRETEVVEVVQEMIKRGFPVRKRLLGLVILHMLKRGEVAEVVNYVRTLSNEDRWSEVKIFRILALKLLKNGRNTEAAEVVQEMINRGLPVVSERLLELVILHMLEGREVAEVVNYVQTLSIEDRGSEVKIFRILALKLFNDGRNTEAAEVVREMIKRDLPISSEILTQLVPK